MVDECYDDDLDPIKGKEDLRQKVSREVAKLIKQCSGDENAWPAYEVATPELLSELDQRWNDAFTGVGNSWYLERLCEATSEEQVREERCPSVR